MSTSVAYLSPSSPYQYNYEKRRGEREENALGKFSQHSLRILGVREAVHDLEFCEFDVDGVVVLAEEDFDVVLQYCRSSLDYEQDVAQGDVLDFWAGGEEGDYARDIKVSIFVGERQRREGKYLREGPSSYRGLPLLDCSPCSS